ncbi:MAG: hypothetical protein QM766_03815 [Burkholderiaceae bacterium]
MTSLKTSLAAILMASVGAHAANMSAEAYSAAKKQIDATYKSEKAACDAMKGNAKDVCVEQAKGREKVAKAELEYQHSGSESDQLKVTTAKADADYAVAKERCDDREGKDKSACVEEAKAARDRVLADVKMQRDTAPNSAMKPPMPKTN